MKTRQSRRQTTKVSHSRWLAYATAGAATALAGTNSAEARIHYSGVLEVVFPPDSSTFRDFQLDQPGDFFVLRHSNKGSAWIYLHGIASRGTRGYSSSDEVFASKLRFGQRISHGSFVSASFPARMAAYCFGRWRDPGIGYIGFRFNSGRGTQYGWARVRMAGCDRNNAFKLIDYAYADPGERIRAGQVIHGPGEDGQDMSDEQGPDEGSLGGLALGAVGLLAWRKNRSRIARLEDA